MRGVWLVAILLAGCLSASEPQDKEAPGEDAPDIREPLPEPRSNNPANNVGYTAINDTTGQAPPSPWAVECVRHWNSGGYTYALPPVIAGKPCHFYPTEEGTLFWHVIDFTGDSRGGVPAAPLERPDGFFDWVVYEQPDHREDVGVLNLYINGTDQPAVTWGELPARSRDGIQAVRYQDTIHVALDTFNCVADAPNGGSGGCGAGLIHAWWRPGEEPQWETTGGGAHIPTTLLRVGPTGVYLSGSEIEPAVVTTSLYRATTGAMEPVLPPLAGAIYDVVERQDGLHACVTIGTEYLHAWLPQGEGVNPPAWLYEPVADGPLAQIAFTCNLADSEDGLVMTLDSPALDGNGPNPLAGTIAYTQAGLGQWTAQEVGASYHNGDDLMSARGTAYHIASTANGTTNGDPKCGFEVRMPTEGGWRQVFCNWGGWFFGLDHPERPMITASEMINPPFETWKGFGDAQEAEREMTSVVLVLPQP